MLEYISESQHCDIFFKWRYNLFIGDIGSGKTTMIRHIIHNYFNVNDIVTSCTYCYYATYIYGNNTIVHMDLYNNNDINNVYIVFELYPNATYFIEFGEMLINVLDKYVVIMLSDHQTCVYTSY